MEDDTALRIQLDRTKRGLEPEPHGGGAPTPDLMKAYHAWPDRFRSKVQIGTGCWLWVACKTRLGYGRYGRGGRAGGVAQAHRYAYELTFGVLPAELVVDHLCRNASCVRPDHLEAVVQGDNLRRGATTNVVGWCRRGLHEWIAANQYVEANGAKRCRPCRQATERAQSPGIAFALRTHCPQGHPYEGTNVRVSRDGHRSCKTCHRDRERVRYHERRAIQRGGVRALQG